METDGNWWFSLNCSKITDNIFNMSHVTQDTWNTIFVFFFSFIFLIFFSCMQFFLLKSTNGSQWKNPIYMLEAFIYPQCVHLVRKGNIDLLKSLLWAFHQIVLNFGPKLPNFFAFLNQKNIHIMLNLFWQKQETSTSEIWDLFVSLGLHNWLAQQLLGWKTDVVSPIDNRPSSN